MGIRREQFHRLHTWSSINAASRNCAAADCVQPFGEKIVIVLVNIVLKRRITHAETVWGSPKWHEPNRVAGVPAVSSCRFLSTEGNNARGPGRKPANPLSRRKRPLGRVTLDDGRLLLRRVFNRFIPNSFRKRSRKTLFPVVYYSCNTNKNM